MLNDTMTDHLFIHDLRIDTIIGFHKHEKVIAQTVSIDIDLGIANQRVFETDRVADCIDYDKVAQAIRELSSKQRFKLVETLAERIARTLIADFAAPWVRVSVTKLGVMKDAGRVGITVERRR